MKSILAKLTKMSFNLALVLRVLQTSFAVVVMMLTAFVIHWYNSTSTVSPPPEFKYLLFTSIWSILSRVAIELIPRFFPRTPKPHLTLPLELSNTLFYLSSWIALCVFFSRLLFCRGAPCHAAQADAAFAAFSSALWAASATSSAMEMIRARRGSGNGHAGTGAMPKLGMGIGGGLGGMKEAAA